LRQVHYITIAVAIILIAILYWGGNTVPPAQKPATTPMQQAGNNGGNGSQGPNTMKAASFDSILTASRIQLPKTVADSVLFIENELAAIRDSSRMAVVFTKLSGVWERNKQYPVGVFYRAQAAKLENSEKKLTFAAQLFLELLEHEGNRAIQLWEASEAISCLELSLKLDSTNEEAKLAMASAYIQGTEQPMVGVQMLLAITREKPDDVPANMLLGRMSIQSGQYEKAIKRFETVLKTEPNNKEALYFLAQAYEETGNKQKAIELLEKCKMVVNNPEFSRDIDQHINSLK
jgi:tetratricopeptide (TPR) repeat protein